MPNRCELKGKHKMVPFYTDRYPARPGFKFTIAGSKVSMGFKSKALISQCDWCGVTELKRVWHAQ